MSTAAPSTSSIDVLVDATPPEVSARLAVARIELSRGLRKGGA